MGNNISDFTIRVVDPSQTTTLVKPRSASQVHLCPAIRYPNFQDRRAHLPIAKFTVAVQSSSRPVSQVPLSTFLKTHIKDKSGNTVDLSADIDNTMGVIAACQQAILPVGSSPTHFNVHSYNYQTYSAENPAVLYILACAQGSAPQVATGGTQTLYMAKDGQAHNLVAKRLKDDRAARGVPLEGVMTKDELERNVAVVFQVPLKKRAESRGSYGGASDEAVFMGSGFLEEDMWAPGVSKGLDHAMISLGPALGAFPHGPETVVLERDPTSMVRATVQYWSAMDSNELPESLYTEIKDKFEVLYAQGTSIKA